MENTTKIIDRIRALLRKAERTDNPHEAEVFAAKAAALMAQAQIDRAMVGDLDPEADPIGKDAVPMGKYPRASAQILHAVAEHFGVVTFIYGSSHKAIYLRGHRSDLDATIMLYTSLRLQADRAMLATDTPPGVATATHRNSFLYGYAARLRDRLRDVRTTAVADSADPTGTAVALRDRALAVRDQSPVLRKANLNGPSLDGRGHRAGSDAANRADLGGTRLGSGEGRKALAR